MTWTQRGAIAAGAVALALAAAVVFWRSGPSESEVRRTVLTTVQEESPASFLVTGTLDLTAEVRVDSSAFVTWDWVTILIRQSNPGLLPLARGSASATVRVPGRVSYGFDVRDLEPEMIRVPRRGGPVEVRLPSLSVHSVEPRLGRLEIRTGTRGWMRLLPSETTDAVRDRALEGITEALRRQANERVRTAAQPRVNTARALEAMLSPALEAAGVPDPRFRIRLGNGLVVTSDTTQAPPG